MQVAEAIAPKISDWLYQTHDPEKLTVEQKETISTISSLLGTASGAVVGDSSANAVQGSLNAKSAVENNFTMPKNTQHISPESAKLIEKIKQIAATKLSVKDMEYIYTEKFVEEVKKIANSNQSEQEKQAAYDLLKQKHNHISQVLQDAVQSIPLGHKDRDTFNMQLVPSMNNLLVSDYYDLSLSGKKPNLLDKERTDWVPEIPSVLNPNRSSVQQINCVWSQINCTAVTDLQAGRISGKTGNTGAANKVNAKSTTYETKIPNSIQGKMSPVDGETVGGNKPPKSSFGDYILPVGKQELDPTRVSFSQATVSYQKTGKGYNYDTLVTEMKKQGKWVGDPVDVVNMPDRAPTSMDNTRILAAREAGIKVKANVHNFDEPLNLEQSNRFYYDGIYPKTWGEAIHLRVIKQTTQKGSTYNWSERFPNGSIYDPKVIKK